MARPRNIQQLMVEWVNLTHEKNSGEHVRGYNTRYLQGDLNRERAHEEAKAAAALAKDYFAGNSTLPVIA